MKQASTKNEKVLIAIYDMDKTITQRATYNGFLAHMAMSRAPWRLLLLPLMLPALFLYAVKILDRKRLKQFAQRILIGSHVPYGDIAAHLESHADKVLARNSHEAAALRMANEKVDGYRHVIATASYRIYVEAIARRFHFDDVIATELSRDDAGHILPRIEGENCYYIAKLDRVKNWMRENGLDREACHIRAYSDHISDAPLLEFADEAFATNPHPPLAKLAVQRGWEIIDWRG